MGKEHLRSFKDWPFKPTLPLLDVEDGYIAVRFRIEEIPGQHIIVSFDEICLSDKLNRTYSGKGSGIYDSISDVCNKLEKIKGEGLYNSIADIYNKLEG